jgi:tol-pal system beta propeller repeat protein TolB
MRALPIVLLAALALSACATGEETPRAGPVFHQDVAWSPDGRRIAYSAFADDTWGVYVGRGDGSARRNIARNAQFVTWSPDGAQLAYSAQRDGDWDIYITRADGAGQPRRVTETPERDTHPAWAPDGAHIAFISNRGGGADLYVLDVASGAVRQLTRTERAEDNPAWSPDGAFLVFHRRDASDHDQIYRFDLATGAERALTSGEASHIFPSVAPSGAVLYVRRQGEDPPRLILLAADGASETTLDSTAFFARFSPDGRHIALISGRWPSSSIWIAPAARLADARLVADGGASPAE